MGELWLAEVATESRTGVLVLFQIADSILKSAGGGEMFTLSSLLVGFDSRVFFWVGRLLRPRLSLSGTV